MSSATGIPLGISRGAAYSALVIPEIDEVRLLRRQLGLTQQELARMAGVSQSLIAKIERGLVQPSYSNVKRLVEALEAEKNRRHPAVTAGATCSKTIARSEERRGGEEW